MTEVGVWEIIKTIVSWALLPILALTGRQWHHQRKLSDKVDTLEEKIHTLDKYQEVHRVTILALREDIKQIDQKLDKIIDKL